MVLQDNGVTKQVQDVPTSIGRLGRMVYLIKRNEDRLRPSVQVAEQESGRQKRRERLCSLAFLQHSRNERHPLYDTANPQSRI
jgi:hypothetical protein